MGNRNVERILYATPPLMLGLPWASWGCLVLMAKAAHDDTQLYWGGVGWLSMQMGYGQSPSGRRKVMRHISLLIKAGYVVRTHKRKGHRSIYELRLPGLLAPTYPQGRDV